MNVFQSYSMMNLLHFIPQIWINFQNNKSIHTFYENRMKHAHNFTWFFCSTFLSINVQMNFDWLHITTRANGTECRKNETETCRTEEKNSMVIIRILLYFFRDLEWYVNICWSTKLIGFALNWQIVSNELIMNTKNTQTWARTTIDT